MKYKKTEKLINIKIIQLYKNDVQLYKMNVKNKIILKIFEDPSKRYYIRELARHLNANPNSVINAVKYLEKEKIVMRDVKRHIVEVYANLNNPYFLNKKRIFNLTQIYECRVIEFLIKNYNPKAIVLFGSYSRGEDIKNSDIDIAIITDKKDIININKFEKALNKKIHLLLLQYKDIPEELYVNLINGIIVYGYLDKK